MSDAITPTRSPPRRGQTTCGPLGSRARGSRTRITLTDAQYARLRDESARSALSLSELIRRAVDDRYGMLSRADRLRLIDCAFGAWRRSGETGEEYVERVRFGTARRLRAS
jgi:predicted DNA-binding ribbon-helix-helix protein